jgi:hypothetical protein
MGVMNERTIMAAPSVSSARAGDSIGDNRDQQLVSSVVVLSRIASLDWKKGEAPEEVEVERSEQSQARVVEEKLEKVREMWWMETAARHKATEANHQVEAGAEVIHETKEETKCQIEAEETCVAEEALHHTVAMHEDCRIYIYRSESGFWGKRLCYCITCRKYMYDK